MMTRVRVRTFTPDEVVSKAASFIAQEVQRHLSEKPVLLLLSGGSAISMYAEMFTLLLSKNVDAKKLTVSLVDERFVPVDSSESNAVQLQNAGILQQLSVAGAQWWPFLKPQVSGEDTAAQISQQFERAKKEDWRILILAGIGDDGHTAGLLPTSDSKTIDAVFLAKQFVQYYQLPADAQNPYRFRVTTTPAFFAQTHQIIIYATGEKKRTALQQFCLSEELNPRLPASYLKIGQADINLLTDQTI